MGVCVVEGVGCVQTDREVDVAAFARNAVEQLGVQSLCFPLLYPEIGVPQALSVLDSSSLLERRPSPVIDWSDRGVQLWTRCEQRLGSRATRRRRRFEESGAACTWVSGQLAVDVIAEIERKSWKSAAGMDMHTRSQFELYEELVRCGFVQVRAAVLDGEPIAYRLDCTVRGVLFCLKWSFNDTYRHLSPGFAMLAIDLARAHGSSAISAVDLYGSPDSLKALLATGERRRCDVYWPQSVAAAEMQAERAEHDRMGIRTQALGGGIRSAYVTE